MDILEKFEKGKESRTYQRIDSEYATNIFLGYNDDGQMSMVITEYGNIEIVKSSKIINVSLTRREDKRLALTFDLLNESYKSLYLIFCKDIIAICEKVNCDMAITTAIRRWKYWKEMFGKKNNNILSNEEIKGLIGELIQLEEFFMKKWDEGKAIASWMGPLLGHKDFEIENTWYEVKCTSENALQVSISSLEQLDSELDGHLVIIRLENSTITNELAFNLNELVFKIAQKITDPENLESYMTKLNNVGYVYNKDYDNFNYIYKGRRTYAVREGFPRITRKDVSSSIGNVKYTIMLDGIVGYMEE